jgi:hypothetical protein
VSAPVTVETLTRESIRLVWSDALDRGDRDLAMIAQVALGEWHGSHRWQSTNRHRIPACDICGSHPGDVKRHIDAAIAHIVVSLNARREAGRG